MTVPPLNLSTSCTQTWMTVYAGSSITFLEMKTWLIANPNSAPVPQSPDRQYMTSTNTCLAVYLGQHWTNICSSWPNSRWRTLIRSVWVNILHKPRIPAAVVAAVTGRLRCWNTRIYRSWTGVVMRGLPLLGRSWADPVWFYLWNCALVSDFSLRLSNLKKMT
jgi:hypothetical protein